MPVSALARRFWMPCVVALSCCAMRLRGVDDADARRLRVRAGRQALDRGQQSWLKAVLDGAGVSPGFP